jgi:glycosyltransferase involved in cell wall biosynthesis
MVTYATGAAYICNLLRKIFGRGVDSEKVPIVLTLQEGDSEEHLKYRWAGLIALSWKMALKYTDFLTGLSSFLIHRAEKSGYEGRSALIPNGVDLRVFSRKILKKDYLEMIQKMGKNPEDIFLVTTSRLNHKNAVDDIISSLALLPDNIYLLVIGIGSEMSKLKAQAIKLGLGKRVKFLGFLPHPEIPKYFSICDIFVRPSRSEGFGNSFIEAMAARLPVIATPVGGIPDFLDDKETGLFCAPDNPKSLAQAIRLLLEDGVLRERIINKAFTRVTERYSWEYVAKEMKEKVFDII